MRHPLRALGGLLALGLLGLALGRYLQGLGEAADAARVVSVYTALTQSAIDALAPRFTQETGIRVEVVKLGSGEVVQRLQAETAAPRADVVWSVAGDQLAANPEVLERYLPPELEAVAPTYRDAVGDGRWLPYTVLVPVLIVRADLADAPRRWDQLAAPGLRGRVSAARADKSGSAYMQLISILRLHGEERGWALIDGMLENEVLSGSSSAVPRLVNDGEAAVGLTLEDAAARYVRGGGPVRLVYPEDGTCPAPDGVALVRGAPHREEAQAFIRWALSRRTQTALVTEHGRRSVRADVAPPSGLPPLERIEARPYDFAWAARNQERVLARWRARAAALGK
ncbi:MAG: extracellular solute-binding protein [Planctomycetota bacterium]